MDTERLFSQTEVTWFMHWPGHAMSPAELDLFRAEPQMSPLCHTQAGHLELERGRGRSGSAPCYKPMVLTNLMVLFSYHR